MVIQQCSVCITKPNLQHSGQKQTSWLVTGHQGKYQISWISNWFDIHFLWIKSLSGVPRKIFHYFRKEARQARSWVQTKLLQRLVQMIATNFENPAKIFQFRYYLFQLQTLPLKLDQSFRMENCLQNPLTFESDLFHSSS